MKIDSPRYIKTEDFPEEIRDSAAILAEVINTFMQQVYDLQDGRIGFENLSQNLITLDLIIDISGKVVGNNLVNTGNSSIKGTYVINTKNLINPSITPTSQPFIVYNHNGQGIIQITKITGLPAGRYLLTVVTV